MPTGAQILAEHLTRLAPGPIFHVPGEGILELLDALATHHPATRLVTARHEAGMVHMAAAAARLTGHVHVCLAARAPGALNTPLALHTAATDAAPVLLVIGQAPQANQGREPFLDDALARVFAPIAKHVATVTSPDRIPEAVLAALRHATAGRPGPVVLILPEDVVAAEADPAALTLPATLATTPDPSPIAALLRAAKRPILLLGGSDWPPQARADIARFAETHALPVATAYRRRELFDNVSPCFAGELGIGLAPALRERIEAADLVLAIGIRLGELNTIGGHFQGFTLLRAPAPAQTLIHIHPDADELSRVYRPTLALACPSPAIAAALAALPPPPLPWREWTAASRAARIAFTTPTPCPGPVDLPALYAWLGQALPADAIVTVGAGAYALWPQRFLPHPQYGPKSGAMGTSLAMAIGAALAQPHRRVLAIAGDGCFMMHAEELATAVQLGLPIVTIVANNAAYGAIRLTQLRQFNRATGTDLAPIDFAALARSFGAHGARVETTAEFAPAFTRAFACGGPAVIDLVIPPAATRP